jgi:hypothetical protein
MILAIPGIIYALAKPNLRPFRPVITASLLVVLVLALLRGKTYYTAGLLPLWIASGAVFWERTLSGTTARTILTAVIVVLTLPFIPMGIPVFNADRLQQYFAWMKNNMNLDVGLRWETGRYHELPQDYADMLGWDEIAAGTARAWQEIPDKNGAMIYAENYGEAGAVMVLGKKFGLPEPVCFSESFYYWFPRNPAHEITTLIYINDEMGDDVKKLFANIRTVGMVTNPLAREFGTKVWLCSEPVQSFNEFWRKRTPMVKSPFE